MINQMMRLQFETAEMLTQANTVVGLRLLEMAGMTPVGAGESVRMMSEKPTAFVEAGIEATAALMLGNGPVTAMEAALVPISTATRANSERLGGKP